MGKSVIPCSLCSGEEFDILAHNEFGVYVGATDTSAVFIDTVLCRRCGLIFHNPLPSYKQLELYYGFSDSPDSDSPIFTLMPEQFNGETRLDGLRRDQAAYLQKHWGDRTGGSLLEIGSYEGHLLSVFQQLGWIVQGVELNRRASFVARTLYGVTIHDGAIDSLSASPRSFDAVVAVHVLEHVNNPKATLMSCCRLLKDNGLLYLEVPDVEQLPASLVGTLFNLEHLYYFSPGTLTNILHSAGFEIVDLSTDIGYPAVRVIARPSQHMSPIESNYQRALSLYWSKVDDMRQLTISISLELVNLVTNWYNNKSRLVIYGAGQHTKYLLKLAKFDQVNVIGLIDSDPKKQGHTFCGYKVFAPADIMELNPEVILISSYGYQNEIYDSLECVASTIQIIRLYKQVFELEEYAHQLRIDANSGKGKDCSNSFLNQTRV